MKHAKPARCCSKKSVAEVLLTPQLASPKPGALLREPLLVVAWPAVSHKEMTGATIFNIGAL